MKHRLFVTFLVLFLVCGCAFAQAVKEQQAEEVKFSSLDLESASLQKIIETFEAETETYNAKRQSIYDKMAEAYSKGNADAYFDAKGLLKIRALSKELLVEGSMVGPYALIDGIVVSGK